MNRQVTAAELKAMVSELLDRAAAGEETLITRHGKPVARIVPVADASSPFFRKPGALKGQLVYDDATLWAPMSEKELDEIEGNVDAFFPAGAPATGTAAGRHKKTRHKRA